MSMYQITYTSGAPPEDHDTYQEAIDSLRAEYGDNAEIGHDGDLDGFGDRTLCWATEADSVDDDGARAVASISRTASTCPECGHPRDGSSGHGSCDHPCHGGQS